MTGFDCRPASGRRNTLGALMLAAGLVCVVTTQAAAQEPAQPPAQPGQPPTQPAPPAAPATQPPAAQPNPFVFNSDAAMLTFFIKPDKAADFEKVMAKLHEALANSDKPERKQQAAGWKLYKGAEPGPNGTVIYVNFLSPALKGADYTISKILAEVFPQEVQQLFPLYRDAFAGLSRAELSLIHDFGAPPKPAQ
jgi:hypothetical protein